MNKVIVFVILTWLFIIIGSALIIMSFVFRYMFDLNFFWVTGESTEIAQIDFILPGIILLCFGSLMKYKLDNAKNYFDLTIFVNIVSNFCISYLSLI